MDATASPTARKAMGGFFVVLLVFLYAPIFVLIIFSFNDSILVSLPLAGFTTKWYSQLLENTELIESLEVSLIIAAISSVVVVGLGVLASYAIVRRRFPFKSATSALLLSPLVIPYLVFGIALLILFQALDDFLIPRFGFYLGFGMHTIVIGHIVVSLPYALLTIVPRLEKLGVSVEEAARDLGASAGSSFRRVTLPLLTPALISSFLVAFTLSFDEYAIASFVAGDVSTYPLFLYGQVRIRIGLPQMIAVSVIVLVASLAFVIFTELWRRRAEQRLDVPTVTNAM
jgi:spermidine/putrescine transport system permease protein